MSTTYEDTNANRVYARVQGDQVVEYPVLAETIMNRGHSVQQYYPVTILGETNIGSLPGMVIETVTRIEGRSVIIENKVREKTLEESIFFFREAYSQGTWTPYNIAAVPKGEFEYFTKKLGQVCEAKLEEVVKERYTSLNTLLARYSNSSNPVWAKESEFIQKALDALWASLIAYFAELRSGAKPLPVSVSDVEVFMKPVSWADMS